MTKSSYAPELAPNKHVVREFLFSFFNIPSVIGLGGPSINHCIDFYKQKGIEEFEIWENNVLVFINQIRTIKHGINLKFGNILNATPNKKVLYDFDYCETIKKYVAHIEKFQYDSTIMTFSLRAGTDYTINKYFEIKKEKILHTEYKSTPINHRVITTNKGIYIYSPYFDTSSMCSIAKIK